MIDTIKLMLGKNMFLVTDTNKFQKKTQNAARGYFTLVQNPTVSELRTGIYKPRLTLTKRFNTSGVFEATLSIELSLSKLLFGNNFDEFEDKDFMPIAEKLGKVLKKMGVSISNATLLSAPISTIHYSKNVPLTDGTTPYYYLKKISEGNYSLSLQTDKANYRNNGQLFKLHVNSWELAFYDKINELNLARRSEKNSIENDNLIQLEIFKDKAMRKPFEVLRMEARLNTRAKIKQILKELGMTNDLTFKSLFSSQISQAVLLHFLGTIEKARPRLLDYRPKQPTSLLPDIIVNNPNLSPSKQVMLFGLKHAMDMYGMRELRIMFGKQKDRTWKRLVDESKKVNLPKTQDTFSVLRKHLTTFKPLKLVDYQEEQT